MSLSNDNAAQLQSRFSTIHLFMHAHYTQTDTTTTLCIFNNWTDNDSLHYTRLCARLAKATYHLTIYLFITISVNHVFTHPLSLSFLSIYTHTNIPTTSLSLSKIDSRTSARARDTDLPILIVPQEKKKVENLEANGSEERERERRRALDGK